MQNCTALKLSPLVSAVIVALVAASCGLDHGNHFKGDKTFGHQSNNDTTIHDGSETPPTPGNHKPTKPGQQSPENSPDQPYQPPETSGHDILSGYGLVGYFDTNSIYRISEGSGPDGLLTNGGFVGSVLKLFFERNFTSGEGPETLDILTSEDGKGRQIVHQSGTTTGGDKVSAFKGQEDTQSGLQTLYWTLGDPDVKRECPPAFICVDKITWKPVKGDTWTYCMRDRSTRELKAVPYAPNPQFGPEAFKAALPNIEIRSKPFIMTKHRGVVDCASTNIETIDMRVLEWRVALGDLSSSRTSGFLKKATIKPLAPDTEISVEYAPYKYEPLNRGYQPNKGPFLDEFSRFNMKVRYFLNSSEHSFVKIVRTIQSTFSLPVDVGITGLQIDYVHEFCTFNAVAEHPFNHCTGKTN